MRFAIGLVVAVSLLMCSIAVVPAAQAANTEIATNVPHAATTNATSLLEEMETHAATLSEYKYECEITSQKGNKTIKEFGTFYFKKPNSIRVDVTGGPKNGSVAVLRSDGKVRGHMGGWLKNFVGTVPADSNLLTSTTGFSLVRSDYKTLASELRKYMQQGWSANVERTTDGSNYLLQMKSPEGKLGKRITVDEKTFLPLEWENTAGGKSVSLCKFRNVVVNPGFSATLFKI